MKKIANPFSTPGSSQVFYRLVLGQNERAKSLATPQGLAKALRKHPATVIEHLRRFQDEGVVSLGKMAGRFQYYRVNWKKFVDSFFRHSYAAFIQWVIIDLAEKRVKDPILGKEIGELIDVNEEKREKELLKRTFEELKKNKYFEKMVRRYFEILAELGDVGYPPPTTVRDAIEEFENAVIDGAEEGKIESLKKRIKNEESRNFLSLLQRWGECAKSSKKRGPRDAFYEAMVGSTLNRAQPRHK